MSFSNIRDVKFYSIDQKIGLRLDAVDAIVTELTSTVSKIQNVGIGICRRKRLCFV
jgi:hypothetical protein